MGEAIETAAVSSTFGTAQALFYYGFVAIIFSSSPWLAFVLAIALTPHRTVVDVFDFLFLVPLNVGLGIWVAWLIVDSAWLPVLVPHLAFLTRTEVTSKDKAEATDNDGEIIVYTDRRPYFFLSGLLLVVVGVLLIVLDNRVSDINRTVLRIIGGAMILFGLAFFIYAVARFYLAGVRADINDVRYLLYLLLFLTLPPIYDAVAAVARPFEGIAFLILFILLIGFIIMVEIRVIGVEAIGQKILLENDPRFVRNERYSISILKRWLGFTAVPLGAIYMLGWALDEASDGDIRVGSVGVSVLSVVIASIVLCCCRREPFFSSSVSNNSNNKDDDDAATSAGDCDSGDMQQQQQQPTQYSGAKAVTKRRAINKGVILPPPNSSSSSSSLSTSTTLVSSANGATTQVLMNV